MGAPRTWIVNVNAVTDVCQVRIVDIAIWQGVISPIYRNILSLQFREGKFKKRRDELER